MDDVYKVVFAVFGFAFAVVGFVLKINKTNSDKFRDVYRRIDDVKDKFVREDHLDIHLKPLKYEIERNRQDQERNHKEIIEILKKN